MVSIQEKPHTFIGNALEEWCICTDGITKQNLVIRLSLKENRDENRPDVVYDAHSLKRKTGRIAEDILLYTFGMKQAEQEKTDCRTDKLAKLFWSDNDSERPSSRTGILKTEQMAKYLLYDDKRKRTPVMYEVHGRTEGNNNLPKRINIRFQLAEPLDAAWMKTVETRINSLFSDDIPHRYRHTDAYELEAIYIIPD